MAQSERIKAHWACLVKHLIQCFCTASMRAAKEAPRNMAKEAGRAGRSTAGNWCGEEEECLSTKPTQTQASSLNLLFTPQPPGTFLWHQRPTQNLNGSFGFAWDVFQDIPWCFIRGLIPQGKLGQNISYSANRTGQQMTAHRPMSLSHTACLT